MELKLDNAPAIIRPRTTILTTTTSPVGKNAKPVPVIEVQMVIEVDVSGMWKQLPMFPNADVIANTIAGQDDGGGMVINSGAKLIDSAMTIKCGSDVVFDGAVTIKAKLQLRIDGNGNGRLIVRPRARLTEEQLVTLTKCTNADAVVSMSPAQLDISDMTLLAPATTEPGGVMFIADDDESSPVKPARRKKATATA